MDQNQINELFKNKDDGKKIGEFVDKNLSAEQKTKLEEILSDKEKLQNLLNSERAKELLKKLKKN